MHCIPFLTGENMKPLIIESHAHLDDRRFEDDRNEVIERAKEAGVARLINVGADLQSSYSALKLAEKHSIIFAAVGVHPHDASDYDISVEKEIIEMAKSKKVVAIGEIGLDYHYDNSPRELQKQTFASQLKVAASLDLPVIIHNREAHRDCLDILQQENNDRQRGVFHCYSGSAEMVREVIELGFYVSFAGVITFKNAKKAVQALQMVPTDKLLFETDCPYLSPEPYRGKRNEPAFIQYTAMKMAQILGLEYESLCKIVWENTHRLFNRLPKNNHMIK
jgi:TatD DNase family protein